MSAPRSRSPGDDGGNSSSAAAVHPAGEPASYPRLYSSSPPLLPLPDNTPPLFTPLGATVPLPPCQGNKAGRPFRAARKKRSKALPRRPSPSRRRQAASAEHQPPAGRRPTPPRTTPPTTLPGVSFCNLVLQNFHLLWVPGGRSARFDPRAWFWLVGDASCAPPSLRQVRNTINFCFSTPARRFDVNAVRPGVFSTYAANPNLASFIVSRSWCRLAAQPCYSSPLLMPPLLLSSGAPHLPLLTSPRDLVTSVVFPIPVSRPHFGPVMGLLANCNLLSPSRAD